MITYEQVHRSGHPGTESKVTCPSILPATGKAVIQKQVRDNYQYYFLSYHEDDFLDGKAREGHCAIIKLSDQLFIQLLSYGKNHHGSLNIRSFFNREGQACSFAEWKHCNWELDHTVKAYNNALPIFVSGLEMDIVSSGHAHVSMARICSTSEVIAGPPATRLVQLVPVEESARTSEPE